jgi:SAM-dependent methyltransferase
MEQRADIPRTEGLRVLTERVYLGPDSVHLVEAALRLAPRGDRAVELGAGAGYLAVALARRYRTVIATDVMLDAAVFTRAEFERHEPPRGHSTAVAVGDVAGGLRRTSFDLVAANTPWVPQPDPNVERVVFAHGGATGVELPLRFLREGAALLRSGGVAITLALDVTLQDGSLPLHAACHELEADGFATTLVPTPINITFPRFRATMLARQPALIDAVHVAVVVGAPFEPGGGRASLLTAAAALGRRWTPHDLSDVRVGQRQGNWTAAQARRVEIKAVHT